MNRKLLFFTLFCIFENSIGQFNEDFENQTFDTFFQKCTIESIIVEEIQKYNVSTPKSGTYALILKNNSSVCLETKNLAINGYISLEIEYSSIENDNSEALMEITVENRIHRVNTTNGTWITFNITQEDKTTNSLKISLKSNGTTFLVNNIRLKQIQDVTTTVTAIDVTATTEPIKMQPDVTTRIEDVTTTNQNVTTTDSYDTNIIYLSTLKRNEIVSENDVTTMRPIATITIAVTTTVEPVTNDTVTTSDVTLHESEVTDAVTIMESTPVVSNPVTDNTVTTTEVTDYTKTVTPSIAVTNQSEQDVATNNVGIRLSNVTVTTDDVMTVQSSTVNPVTAVTDSVVTSSRVMEDDITSYNSTIRTTNDTVTTTVTAVTDSVDTSSSVMEENVTNYNTTTLTTNVTVTISNVVTELLSAVADNVTTTSEVSITFSDVTTSSNNNVTAMKLNVTETVTVTDNVTEASKADYCFCNYFYSVVGAVVIFYYF